VLATGWGNMLAEQAVVSAKAVLAIPDTMSFDEAAVFRVSYCTAWHALVQRAHVRRGETLLVLGAGGATGYAAIQIGKHLGARVIGSASTSAKRDLAIAAGADAVVDTRSKSWREDVKEVNGDKPIDVIFDPVGGSATDPAFRLLSWKGRHLVIGFAGGIAALRTNLPLLRGASLIGVDLRQFTLLEPAQAAANTDMIIRLANEGKLKPAIGKRYPFEDFALAMHDAAEGKSAGRVVIVMSRKQDRLSHPQPGALPVINPNDGTGDAF
jgi:NADPH:quinone reductase